LYFQTFMAPPSGYAPAGTLVSPAKDVSALAAGQAAPWISLAWTGATPTSTALKFQLAGSSSAGGPFNFVGPDGTAGSYFTTSGGAPPAQAAGQRYLKWKAYLSTSDSAVTPSLADVTLCFNNTPTLTLSPASGVYNDTTTLTATLSAGGSPLVGLTVNFTLHGAPAGSAATNSAGVAVVSGVSLSGLEVGAYADDVSAAYAGDSTFYAANDSAELTVLPIPTYLPIITK
jgi:hypothetical protein